MPLEFEYEFCDGITVPYAPIFDNIRRNRGFIDTRRRPDLAATIAEGAASAALRDVLVDIASRDRYFSLGCDLGEHQEADSPASQRFIAGGYVQLSGFRYELQETGNYDQFCRELESELRCTSKDVNWRIQFRGTWVSFQLLGEKQVTKPSIWIWFFAAERTRKKVLTSREKLLESLLVSLNQESVYMKFR